VGVASEGCAVSSTSIAVILGSSRKGGNSERFARLALRSFAESEVDVIDLKEYRINTVIDQRHDPGGFQPQEDDYDLVLRRVLDARVLLLATPVYWYALPSHVKAFIDRWSASLRDPSIHFRRRMMDKRIYLIAVGAEDDKSTFEPLVTSLKLTAAYLGMDFWSSVLVSVDRPGQAVTEDGERARVASLLQGERGYGRRDG
jgi:multimeric flavodoxin WrbA